jgi:hypothetical protein
MPTNTDTVGSTHVLEVGLSAKTDEAMSLSIAEISAKNENGRGCPGDVMFMISDGLLVASLFTRLSGMPREPLCSVALRDTKRHGRRGHAKSASSFQAGAEKQLATLDLWCPQGAIYSLALHDKHKVSYFFRLS